MTDMNILDKRNQYFPQTMPQYNGINQEANREAQNKQMMNSGNSFANWAMQKPGTVDAMRRGGNYDGWNALADIIGAYWDNRPEEAGNDGMGTLGNSGAGSTQAVIGSLGNIGGTLGNAAGSTIGEAANKALPEIWKALGGLKLFG